MTRPSESQLFRIHSRIASEGEHWKWRGSKNSRGYGNCRVDDSVVYVHALLWKERFGPIPKRHRLENTCGLRLCVNPDHWKARPFG